jgi:hypothetical protein
MLAGQPTSHPHYCKLALTIDRKAGEPLPMAKSCDHQPINKILALYAG